MHQAQSALPLPVNARVSILGETMYAGPWTEMDDLRMGLPPDLGLDCLLCGVCHEGPRRGKHTELTSPERMTARADDVSGMQYLN